MLARFFKDSFIYGAGTFVTRGIQLVLLPLYTRLFTTADYGIIDMITVLASLVTILVPLEILQGASRFYADETEQDRKRLVSTGLWFSCLMLAGFVVLAMPFSDLLESAFLGERLSGLTSAFALSSIAVTGIFYYVQQILRFRLQSKEFALASIVYSLTSISITIFAVAVMDTGVVGVFYGSIIGGTLAGAFAYRRSRTEYVAVFDFGMWKRMVQFSLPLLPSSVGVFVALYVDRILINKLMSLGDVGVYGVAYRFATAVALIMTGFQSALTPLVYQHYKEPNTPTELSLIFRYFTALALFALLGYALFARELVMLFTTPAYYAAAPVIPLLAAGVLFSGMYIFAPGLSIEKRTKSIAIINIASAAVNTLLNFVLIPRFGLAGSAAATLSGSFLAFTATMVLSQRYYPVKHDWVSLIGAMILATGAGYAGAMISLGSLEMTIVGKFAVLLVTEFLVLLILIEFENIRKLPSIFLAWRRS